MLNRQENLNLKFLYKIPFTTLPQKKKKKKKIKVFRIRKMAMYGSLLLCYIAYILILTISLSCRAADEDRKASVIFFYYYFFLVDKKWVEGDN